MQKPKHTQMVKTEGEEVGILTVAARSTQKHLLENETAPSRGKREREKRRSSGDDMSMTMNDDRM